MTFTLLQEGQKINLAFHSSSGCDATSAFYGLGKNKIYKIVKNSKDYMQGSN